jgi:dethiobiotin synthetase
VLNGPLHPDNPRTLEQLGGVPLLAQLPPLAELNSEALRRQWQASALAPRLLEPDGTDAQA